MIPLVTDNHAEEFIEALGMPNSILCKDTITLSVSLEEHKSTRRKEKALTAWQIYSLLPQTLQICYI